MMTDMERFPFSEKDESLGVASSLPYLPLTFTYRNHSLLVSGLLDTGASVNVFLRHGYTTWCRLETAEDTSAING